MANSEVILICFPKSNFVLLGTTNYVNYREKILLWSIKDLTADTC